MAASGDSYSRMVAWLKIVLPLTALAILSTLFLVSKSIDPTLSLPITPDELKELTREPKIGNPSFSGVTDNGSAIDLSAEIAVPLTGEQSGLRATGLRGIFETRDGRMVDISAHEGILDNTAKIARLPFGVSLATSTGYLIETDSIIADLNTSMISTGGAISATGPLGEITAGQFVLQQKTDENSDSGYELVFKSRVKLIYTPQQQ